MNLTELQGILEDRYTELYSLGGSDQSRSLDWYDGARNEAIRIIELIKWRKKQMQIKNDAPRITVAISIEGEPWGTCNFRSWQEIIDYLQPRADEEKRCKEEGQ